MDVDARSVTSNGVYGAAHSRGLHAAQSPSNFGNFIDGAGQPRNLPGQPMTFAGAGHGNYVLEQTYTYVGPGGDFNAMQPPALPTSPPASRRRVVVLGAGICLAVFALTACAIAMLHSTATTTVVKSISRVEEDPAYDCTASFANWASAWTIAKKNWCCEHVQRACDMTTTLPSLQPLSQELAIQINYDCEAGWDKWEVSWSLAKKAYCCQVGQKGCPSGNWTPAFNGPFDCAQGSANWEAGWSPQKKVWCCSHKHLGCPQTTTIMPTTTAALFECDLGFYNWRTEWSATKQAWCCLEWGKGCPEPTTTTVPPTTTAPPTTQESHPDMFSLHFDCAVAFSNWEAAWSIPKQVYCCSHESRGCTELVAMNRETTTPSAPYDCEVALGTKTDAWSDSKKSWCCKKVGTGCTTRTQPDDLIDCDVGSHNWQEVWSARKKVWCCEHEGRGCSTTADPTEQPTTTMMLYNCESSLADWRDAWSIPKQAWCCSSKGKGCPDHLPVTTQAHAPSTSEEPAFDCDVALDHWRYVWPDAKQEWCCKTERKGCEDAPMSTPAPLYECDGGVENWRSGWSDQKKEWCCTSSGLGCISSGGTTAPPFDCEEGFVDWQAGWSVFKKAWCCKREGKGCVV